MRSAVPHLAVLFGLSALTACGAGDLPPVTVDAPGVANPELDLHRALDEIHTFLTDFNGRLPTPARATVALQVTQPAPLSAVTPAASAPTPAEMTPVTRLNGHDASRMIGRDGTVWFAYRDGTPRIGTRPGTLSLVWLQAGERIDSSQLVADPSTAWHIDLIPGKRGLHATPALAVRQTPGARQAALRFTTSKRSYAIMLDPDAPVPDVRVRFVYGKDDPDRQPDIVPDAASARASLPLGRLDTLRITGPEVPWKPMRVYRDGGRTYIQFPPGGINAAPRLVVVSPAEKAPQSYKRVGDSYVVDRLIDDGMLIGLETGSPTVHFSHGGAP